MVDDLITCRFRHLFGPIRNVAEIQFDHVPTCLADDMVMMVLYFTDSIFNTRTVDDLKDNAERLEEIERPVDRGQSDLPLLLEEAPVEFLVYQKPWMTQSELFIFEKPLNHNRLGED
jgi:hypothetical protein